MTTVFQVAEQRIKEDLDQIERVLLSNRVESMDHYRYLTGQLRGLTVALNRIKDLEIQVNNDDDWDN